MKIRNYDFLRNHALIMNLIAIEGVSENRDKKGPPIKILICRSWAMNFR